MTETPELEDIPFPCWLVCICSSDEKFDEAEELLWKEHGLLYATDTEIEHKNRILPRTDISLEDTLPEKWGIGRVRFRKTDTEMEKKMGGPYVEMKYFLGNVPWEQVQSNPLRPVAITLYNLLRPHTFRGWMETYKEFPYKNDVEQRREETR